MKRQESAFSGMGVTVALCTLIAVTGTGAWVHFRDKPDENVSRVQAGNPDIKETPGVDPVDPEYGRKVQQANDREAVKEAASGGSAIPRPVKVLESAALNEPAAPPRPQGDPVAAWRSNVAADKTASAQGLQPPSGAHQVYHDLFPIEMDDPYFPVLPWAISPTNYVPGPEVFGPFAPRPADMKTTATPAPTDSKPSRS
jgi:hypothetical protein